MYMIQGTKQSYVGHGRAPIACPVRSEVVILQGCNRLAGRQCRMPRLPTSPYGVLWAHFEQPRILRLLRKVFLSSQSEENFRKRPPLLRTVCLIVIHRNRLLALSADGHLHSTYPIPYNRMTIAHHRTDDNAISAGLHCFTKAWERFRHKRHRG